MKKIMYSLMLAQPVVEAIDQIAARQGTNRSNLINQVLAEYVSLTTPEKLIYGVFSDVEAMLGQSGGFSLFYSPNDNTLSIKSSLEYRYRPTIRYEVELYRMPKYAFGEFKVNFRTQSPALLIELTRFFKMWVNLESVYLAGLFPDNTISYELSETRFTRSLATRRGREYDARRLSSDIAGYVRAFDELMKGWLSGKYAGETELENQYLAFLNEGSLNI